MNGQQNIKYKASLVKYLSQTANSSNHFMDPSSSLISDGKRYTDFVCTIVFVRVRRCARGTSWHTLLHRLDLKLSSSDGIPLTQLRFTYIFWLQLLHNTMQLYPNYRKTSHALMFILLLCTAAIGKQTRRHTDRKMIDMILKQRIPGEYQQQR